MSDQPQLPGVIEVQSVSKLLDYTTIIGRTVKWVGETNHSYFVIILEANQLFLGLSERQLNAELNMLSIQPPQKGWPLNVSFEFIAQYLKWTLKKDFYEFD